MLIGLGNHAEVGKDTIAGILVKNHEYAQDSFAAKLKELALAINPSILPPVALNVRIAEGKLRTIVARYGWDDAKKLFPAVRTYLQDLGVAARETFGVDFWVKQVLDGYTPENLVISDVRFESEAVSIKQCGGVVVNVTRPGHGAVNDHVSEHELDAWEWDYVLKNDSTLEDLEYSVMRMLEKLGARVDLTGIDSDEAHEALRDASILRGVEQAKAGLATPLDPVALLAQLEADFPEPSDAG